MIRVTRFSRLLLACGVLAVAAGPAAAGLLPVQVTVTPENDKFRWTYAIVLPTDSQIRTGDYFTIYDFAGFNPNSNSQPSDWVFTTQNVGPTPPDVLPTDDAAVPNLSWQYTGPTVTTGQIGLGNFWALSDYGSAVDSFFTASTHRTSDGKLDNNITSTTVPVPAAAPEPATLALVGLGLPLVVLARRRKRGTVGKADGTPTDPAICG
jgi:hypothetical protein